MLFVRIYSRWCSAAIVLLLARSSFGAPALTTIQDILYKADGTRFSGTLYITWTSFQSGDSSPIPTQGIAVPVVSGVLRTQLIPTTDASPGANYTVRYSSQGKYQFSETWAVPPSAVPLRVRDVRIATGAVVGPPPVLTQMLISDVAGLANELALRPPRGAGFQPARAAVINSAGLMDAATGNSQDCVRVDGTSGPCGSSAGGGGAFTTFVDSETPAGAVDGANTTFTLVTAPSPSASLSVYRNGLLMKSGLDYTATGATINFSVLATPQPQDVITASYRLGDPTSPLSSFTAAQVVCSGAGSSTGSISPVILGSCTIPPNVLKAGDRIEIRFDYAHSGTASGFTSQVTWGGSTVLSRSGPAGEAFLSGRSSFGLHSGGAQWATDSWTGGGAASMSIGNAPDSPTAAIAVRFLGQIGSTTSDTVALRAFSVIRYPAQSNP